MKNLTNNKEIRNLSNRPSIKFNGGSPVCVCNDCYVIISRVYYREQLGYVLLNGDNPPLYCQTCLNKSNGN